MTVEGGYFKVARGWMDHPELASIDPFSKGEAWLWLIEEAAFADRQKRVSGAVVELHRGQLSCSVRFMAKAWRWEPTRVQRFLKRLKTATMIATDSATGQMVITICNYNVYQGENTNSATATATRNATASLQQRHKREEREKGKTESPSSNGDPILFPEPSLQTDQDDFEAWWQYVPKKVGKGQARKAFPIALKKAGSFAALLDGIKWYAASVEGKDERYTAHPATWLNGERWLDGISAPTTARPQTDPEWEAAKAQGGDAMDAFLERRKLGR